MVANMFASAVGSKSTSRRMRRHTHTHTHTHTWQGPSALHLACEKGHSDAVCALVDLGADVNSLTSELTTPLHYAVENGRKGVCVTSD